MCMKRDANLQIFKKIHAPVVTKKEIRRIINDKKATNVTFSINSFTGV